MEIDQDTKAAYAIWASDTIRYGDTDRQGHVNNAVFATLLETGRVAFLCDPKQPITEPGTSFVIARLAIDFRSELNWPGMASIGTRVEKIGNSSATLEQAIFQGRTCVAQGQSVIVLMDQRTRKSTPLSPLARAKLAALQVRPPE